MQAVSMDTKGAAISGIVPDHINMITWAISGGLGALGGVFFVKLHATRPINVGRAADYICRGCDCGRNWINYRYIDCRAYRRIYGGIGGLLLSPELRGVFTMLLIILVLVMRPQGLFGREEL